MNVVNQNDDFIKVVDFFLHTEDDEIYICDDTGRIVNDITREQVSEIIRYRIKVSLKHDFRNMHVYPQKEIKMFLTDCDGCLTDGGMYYSENGDELKKFNTKDGMGFSFLRKKGIITGIVTGENVQLNLRRAEKLKLDVLESGCTDKLATVKKLCEKYQISLDEVAYVGDDVNDLEVIQSVGFGCCPANAVSAVRRAAKYVTAAKGGEGVIREVIELLLR